jgi:HAD superfamily hydrolase (TIGR01549 family)
MITAGADIASVYHVELVRIIGVVSAPTVRAVLFDLDDTLFDHTSAARAALRNVHAQHACFASWRFEDLERAHARFLEDTHLDVLAGTKTVDEARLERFRRLFAAAGVAIDPETLESTAMAYRRGYIEGRHPVHGALEVLAAIAPHARIGIVSNNIKAEQEAKVTLCGFDPYIDALVVSGEIGISKPDPRIFHVALEQLGVRADDAVMVGDSWTADIEGARAAGIRAIWFNRMREACPDPSCGVEELSSLQPVDTALAMILSLSVR